MRSAPRRRSSADSTGRLGLCLLVLGCSSAPPSAVATRQERGERPALRRLVTLSTGNQPDAAAGGEPSQTADPASPQVRDREQLPLATDFDAKQCPALELSIDVHAASEYASDRGVLVKVLQSPAYTAENQGDPDAPAPAVGDWDRDEYPEGACVLRLRGLEAPCYQNQESVALRSIETDAGTRPIVQASLHARRWAEDVDLCGWPVPGCPSPQWNTFHGYWWYLAPREQDTLLVVCAASCSRFFAEETKLRLLPQESPGVCE